MFSSPSLPAFCRLKNFCRWGLLSVFTIAGSTISIAQRPLGTDVSHYQGNINWANVKAAGVTFAWAKATESTGYTDPYFAQNMANAKAVGIPIGAYHFARPSSHPNITGANSAETEAAHFWAVIGNYVTNGGAYMVPMLDWEDTGVTKAAGFTTTNMSAWANQFCNTISNYARAKGITIKPIIYTGVWFSSPSSTYPGLNSSVTIWPSWIAAYPSNPNAQTGGPSSSYPWSSWNFWQYADTNWSGGDSDVFNGTAAGLATYVIGGLGPPSFISQPSSRFVDQGSSLTMNVRAGGAAPLKYQWRFNGANISAATNSFYTRANIQLTNAGNYTVVVTNSSGSITSGIATLTVNPFYTTVFSDNFDVDSSGNWALNRSSTTNTRAIFAYDYTGIGLPVAPNTTNGTKKGLRMEANISAGVAAALNVSPIGQNFGGNYRLHFDMWINANGPFPLGGIGSTEHLTAGVGTAGNRVQWGSGTSDGSWFAIDGEGQATDTSPDIRAYIGTTLQTNTTGIYAGGLASDIRRCSNPYYSNVFPGGQTAPPTQQSAYAQQTGGLSIGTVGMVWRNVVISKTNNTVEWFIDGLKIASITNALASSNIFVGYWDTFASLSDNTNLSFGIVDNLRVEIPVVAPSISSQPQDLIVLQGTNATFSVLASGTPSPTYQWRFNGTNIPSATVSSYSIANVQMADAGLYSVVVSNVANSTTSSNATLTVMQLEASNFSVDGTGAFQMTVSGAPGASYTVYGSTNLINWDILGTFNNPSGTFQFTDTSSTNFLQRFYRVSAP